MTMSRQMYHLILSRGIDDRRVLQCYWIQGATGNTKPKIVVSGASLDD